MITIHEWKEMSGKEQTAWLMKNKPAGRPRKLVGGVGVNDAPYCTQHKIDGNNFMCPAYQAWTDMLTRVYSAKYHARSETYKGVTACEEWHSLMSFREWWLDHHIDGFALDKDLLSNAGVYSPDTCIFVPQWINVFASSMRKTARNSLIGAGYIKRDGVFAARCMNPLTGVNEYLGTFTNEHGAHESWRSRKMSIANELKSDFDKIDERIYPSIIKMIGEAK